MDWGSIYSLLSSLLLFWSARRGKEDVGLKQLSSSPAPASCCSPHRSCCETAPWTESDNLSGKRQVNPVLVVPSCPLANGKFSYPACQAIEVALSITSLLDQPSLFTDALLLEWGQQQYHPPGRCSTRRYDDSISSKVLFILSWPERWKRSPYLYPRT